MYELRKQSHPLISLDMSNGLLEAVLAYVKEKKLFVSTDLVEDDPYAPTGIIKELTEDYVYLLNFTSSGTENGISYIKKEDIHRLFVESMPEQDLKLLYNDLNK